VRRKGERERQQAQEIKEQYKEKDKKNDGEKLTATVAGLFHQNVIDEEIGEFHETLPRSRHKGQKFLSGMEEENQQEKNQAQIDYNIGYRKIQALEIYAAEEVNFKLLKGREEHLSIENKPLRRLLFFPGLNLFNGKLVRITKAKELL